MPAQTRPNPSIDEIGQRARRIGVSLGALADAQSIRRSTVWRAVNRKHRPRQVTLRKLHRELVAREIDLRDALCRRHGVPRLTGEGRG
jgi:hypothetical protein